MAEYFYAVASGQYHFDDDEVEDLRLREKEAFFAGGSDTYGMSVSQQSPFFTTTC